MIRKIFLFILLLNISNAFAACGPLLNETVQKTIDATKVKYDLPGIQVSVWCPGENQTRDFVTGTKIKNGNDSIKADTLFQVGSETKSFIATIILQLEAEGFLSIEDPIGKWLPQLPDSWKSVTIKQLLNHTSGLPNYNNDLVFYSAIFQNPKKQWTPDELLSFAINKPLHHEPGKGWDYSNTNYIVAGMIIRTVTNMSIDEEIQTRLLIPLNLSNTYYLPYSYNANILQRIAHGYLSSANPPRDVTEVNMSVADSAGALVSTSHDIAIWFKTFLSGSLLPAAQFKELNTLVDEQTGQPFVSTKSGDIGWGLGVKYINDESGGYWLHAGETIGYSAVMAWLKCEDIIITISTNSSTQEYNVLNELLSNLHHADKSCVHVPVAPTDVRRGFVG